MLSPVHALPIAPEQVLVFRTSVQRPEQVNALRSLLDLTLAGTGEWNFDLEDRDHILRVEAANEVRERIMALLIGLGHTCVELE